MLNSFTLGRVTDVMPIETARINVGPFISTRSIELSNLGRIFRRYDRSNVIIFLFTVDYETVSKLSSVKRGLFSAKRKKSSILN